MMTRSISKNSLLLGLFAVITTGACIITFSLCSQMIEANKKAALENRLAEVMPPLMHNNNLLDDTITLHPSAEFASIIGEPLYLAFSDGHPIGLIIPATAPDGYGGAISLLVGLYYDGTVSGVRVVPPHLETPGLGDAIETKKSDWILSFNDQSLASLPLEKWKVKKEGGEFDQFTGATITPRAVINAVKETLRFYQDKRDAIFLQHSLNQLKESSSRTEADSEPVHEHNEQAEPQATAG